MQIGIIGLGRMGGNVSCRLTRAGHHCVDIDANAEQAPKYPQRHSALQHVAE
jgi:6-phosphogluconate dehydrogenase (decarboxylating)